MYKIIVLDLDGTLTNSEKKITEKTKNTLLTIQKKGIIVVLASGRPTYGIISLAKELELEKYGGYIISYNGAKIINCKTNEIIYNKTIPKELIPILLDEAKKNDVNILGYVNENIIAGNGINKYSIYEGKVNNMKVIETKDFINDLIEPANKCLITGEPDLILKLQDKLRNDLGDKLSIYRSESFFLEIMSLNIDKALSINELLKALKIDKKDLICIGDGFNDKSMIEFAGLGIAMENAKQEVKDIADFITKSNNDDGVAFAIEKFILEKNENK